MTRTFNMGLVFAMVLMLTLACLGGLVSAAADSKTTSASVTFTYGDLEWLDPASGEFDAMDLAFDEHPTPMNAVTYNSINGPHVLRIGDGRAPENTGNWQVTVQLSVFALVGDENETFLATISLTNPSTEEGEDALTKNTEILVTSEASPQLVMTASSSLGRGIFVTTWQNNDTQLIIQQVEALKIKAGEYKATLTWALSIVP